VASDDREIALLYNLADRGCKNRLYGLKFLSQAEVNKREPKIRAKKALLVAEEGIVDYNQVMQVMAQNIESAVGKYI
jgi:L-2-hydroxyglutarate oxidase